MALKVVNGPFEALEDSFAAKVAALKPGPGAKPLLVVAPSRRLADRLERLLAVERGLATAGVHFHTFHSLAAAILEETAFPDAELSTDPDFHDAVVDGLLDRAPAFALPRDLRPAALASAVRASLRDLVDAGVDAAALREHFEGELARGAADRERLQALLVVLEAYDERLRALGLMTGSGLTRAAAEAARGSAWLDGFSAIFYYGFYDLTGLQRDVFEAVASSREATVFYPYRKGHPAFRFADAFYEQTLAARPREELEAGGVLAGALDALFDAAKAPSPPPPGALELVSASGARDEAWAAAKECARLADRGVPLDRIAVVARVLGPYRAVLGEAFAAEGIPLDLSCGDPLLRRPLAKAALDLLTLRRRDFPAALVEELAQSPYFRAPEGDPRSWPAVIEAAGVRAGWLQWRGKVEPRPEAGARQLWRFLSDLREELGPAPAPWSAHAARAKALVTARLALPRDARPDEREAWETTLRALDALAAFDRLGENASWETFLETLERKLGRAELDADDGRLGVRALDAMDARGHRFDAVIILGLKEKLFPRAVPEDPVLRDSARAALRDGAGYWVGLKGAGYEEERLLFYLVCASARERLVCVYPRSDESGKAEVASTYLRELCRAAGLPPPGEAPERRVARQPDRRLAELEPELLTPREAGLLASLRGDEPDEPALAEGLRLVARLGQGGAPGPHDGLTRPPAAEVAVWKERGLSPSALDEYAACPFRFFAKRLLKLGVEEEANEAGELGHLERGRIYHAVLERFHRSGGADLEGALDAVFAENDWKALGLYPLLWEAERRAMSESLRLFAAWDMERLGRGPWRPAKIEHELRGGPEALPGTGVSWRGRADRVDLDEKGKRYRVADYKTKPGRWKKDLTKQAAEGKTHQLPIYSELIAAELGEGWSYGGAELLFVEEGKIRSAELSPEDWAAAREPFLKKLAERVHSIAAGRFPIKPDESERGLCSRCEFAGVCRKGHSPSRARASRVPLP